MNALNAPEALILLKIGEWFSNPLLDAAARAMSWLGDGGRVFILLAAVMLCTKRTRACGVVLAAALALDYLVVNVTIKPLVARMRPYDYSDLLQIIIAPPSGLSFPSGHTAVAFAAAGALSIYDRRMYIAALIFAFLMGLSRIYLMVHYPTDVLAGAVIGSICGLVSVKIWKCINKTGGIG